MAPGPGSHAQKPLSTATSAGPAYPFGTHRWTYNANAIRPTQDQGKMDAAVRALYDHWKANYLVRACGGWVVKGGQPTGIGVSEGQGYGMMILPVMAGYDPQAQEIFDSVYRFTRQHPTVQNPDLMSWLIGHDCKTVSPYAAADGDLDIAFGLLMADRQWGSKGSIDYKAEAIKIINAIKQTLTLPEKGYILAKPPNVVRTSDFMPGHFRAFMEATGDRDWQQYIDRGYELMDFLQTRYAPKTGLIPDFAVDANTSDPRPSPGNVLESDMEGHYAYNAGRNPWRLASDYIVSGDPRAQKIAQRMVSFFKQSSGGKPSRIRAVYRLDGTYEGNYEQVFFQTPIAVGAMVDRSNQQFMDSMWNYLSNRRKGNDYYGESVQLLSLIVLSGNWFQP
jgi:endo-1,4-beta-D-glucanase Y